MENTREEILAAIRQELSELKNQVSALEARLAAIESESPADPSESAVETPAAFDDAMMAISIDDIMDVDFGEPEVAYEPVVEEPEAEEPSEEPEDVVSDDAEQIAAIEDEIFGDVEVPAEAAVEEPAEETVEPEDAPVEEPAAAPVEEPVEEQIAAPVEEDLPESFPEEDDEPSFMDIFGMAQSDEGTLNAKHRAGKKKAVMDVMATKEAWRSDMPGSPVKDIRSAISLNDRILFIRTLFDEDPVIFQDTIAEVNEIATLDEAVEYLKEHNPAWDFDSDVVYRFMMAVRRKIR